MTKNKDLGTTTTTIDSEESYRKHLVEQEQKIEANFFQVISTIDRPKDDITWKVMEDLATRAKKGYIKYNTTLQENNHQNMLQHAYEETLDLAQYLKKEITTLNTVQDLVKQYPNDQELGAQIRKLYVQK
jgi:DNA-binding ferritin-like protein